MVQLTKEREIAPYAWVHPDDDDSALTIAVDTAGELGNMPAD
jgi:hypothetical protein